MKSLLALPSFLLLTLAMPASAATYVVSSLASSGTGTLASAITSANGHPGSTNHLFHLGHHQADQPAARPHPADHH